MQNKAMDIKLLSGPERPPLRGKTPKQLVVFLHGLGADGSDLIGLVPLFAETFPEAHFISPHAPFPCDMAPFGRQWFSLLDRREAPIVAGIQIAHPILDHFLDQQLARFGLTDSQLFLVGFSQGTMMALHTAPRRSKACAGVLGFSGALMGGELLSHEAKTKPPICLVHGMEDEVVPFAALARAEALLQAADIPIETHAQPGLAHGISPEGIAIGIAFFEKAAANIPAVNL